METVKIQVPADLFQRLRPYQNDLVHLLELGLDYLEEKASLEPESAKHNRQKELIELLHQAGIVGPDVDTMVEYVNHPDNQNWHPIQADGKPASDIIIEQRRGILDD